MKIIIILVLISLASSALPGNSIRVTYVDKITSWWGAETIASQIAMPGYAHDHLYTVVNYAFLVNGAAADALSVWNHPFGYMEAERNPFGASEEQVLIKWKSIFNSKGIKVVASAFGATEFPTSAGTNPDTYCPKLAQFVKDHHMDGIDLDWEDNAAMENGTGEDWLIRCTKAIRNVLPKGQYLLTHAPQAPYFAGTSRYRNGGYLTVDREVGNLIDWYNVQFYNQGDTSYDSYEKLFISAGGYFSGTSVKEMMAKGIPKEKIVIGKPVERADAVNTGWISASDFHSWASRAATEIGWSTGMMDWQYSSDYNGAFVKTYMNGVAEESFLQ